MPDIGGLAPYLKFLHIAAMITAVTLIVGGDLYFLRVATGGHAQATAQLGHAIRRRGPITGPIIEIGIIFGILAALSGGFDLRRLAHRRLCRRGPNHDPRVPLRGPRVQRHPRGRRCGRRRTG